MHTIIALKALSGLTFVSALTPSSTYDGPVQPGFVGIGGNAFITTNNPVGVTYTATLPNSNTTGIRGYVAATSNTNGTGVKFNVNLFGFPDASLGPFCKSLILPD